MLTSLICRLGRLELSLALMACVMGACSSSSIAPATVAGQSEASSALSSDSGTQAAYTPSNAPGLCLSVVPGATENGASVEIDSCTGGANQKWTFINNTLRIFDNKCLDVTDGVAANGTKLQIWECVTNSTNQTWQRDGNHFVWQQNFCVDVTDGATRDGTRVQIWGCFSNNINQSWAPVTQTQVDPNAQLAQAIKDLNQLLPFSSQDTTSAATVMGTHYAGAANTTLRASDSQFFEDATQQPPDMTPSGTFPVVLYPLGTPSPSDILQHGIGDCVGDAALADLAYMVPDFIKSIITDTGNGTFSVKMFDPQGRPMVIKVNSTFFAGSDGGISAVSAANGQACWATVLEKAAWKYISIYKICDNIGGIGSEVILPMFIGSGASFAFNDGALTPAQLTQAVRSGLAQGMFITGGFDKVMALGIDETITAHAFSVFMPSNANTMVSMRNPWGVNETVAGGAYDTSTGGLLDIPISTDWSNHIDLRLIAPGVTFSGGRTTPYTTLKSALVVMQQAPVNLTEPHAVALRKQKSSGNSPQQGEKP